MSSRDELAIDVQSMGLANAGGRHPLPMARPHRHNEVELNFVETGSMTYLFGGSRVTVCAGQLALFWATTPHQTIDAAQEAIFHWLTVPFATFLQWRLPDMLIQQIIRGKFILGPAAGQLQSPLINFRQWQLDLQVHAVEQNKIVLLEVEACLRRLALSLHAEELPLTHITTSSMPGHAVTRVEQMACFIAEHATEPLHVADIASAVHLHPNYAISLFRKHFGISITAYITHHRIAHAQRLLITTQANISQIALEAGFGSVSRFYSVFKEACGQLPNEYRSGLQTRLSSP